MIDWIIFFTVLAQIETGDNSNAINYSELAYGQYQIRPIFLQEYYRLTNERVQMIQIWESDEKAKEVIKFVLIYQGNYFSQKHNFEITPELYAKIFNGGPNGPLKESTVDYGRRFVNLYNKLISEKVATDGR